MEPTINPFASPLASTHQDPWDGGSTPLHAFQSRLSTAMLRGTRLWVWLTAAFLICAGAYMAVTAGRMLADDIQYTWSDFSYNFVAGTSYLVLGGVLARYGWRIGSHLRRGDGNSLLNAIEAQRLFFQAVSLILICWLCFCLLMVAAVIMGVDWLF